MRSKPSRSVLIIVPDGTLLFEAVGIADIFHQANQRVPDPPPYRVQLAALGLDRVAHGRSGVSLLADRSLRSMNAADSWDTILVTGRGTDTAAAAEIAPWLARADAQCRRMVSVCTGAFLLASAGLLDGRRATTHWKAVDQLAAEFPQIQVDPDAIYVRDGKYWTSAGASSGFDLALALVEEDLGFVVARDVARYLVLFLRRPGGQSQFSRALANQASEPGPIRDVQAWALDNLDSDLALERLADRAAMSPRNFARVFARQTGTTPARFVEQIRIEAACQRLEQGRETLERVASVCGFGTALTLRRTFERHLGINPSDYRNRFGMI